ncbi:unnamed protein product [Ilex paraguariensis]|uniref:Bacterial surface antigen (D15) domain-containing protein n=1 Tax=Ilex paraguariensis TaxID=185542 RepID=A0ABC8TY82_9AQUA
MVEQLWDGSSEEHPRWQSQDRLQCRFNTQAMCCFDAPLFQHSISPEIGIHGFPIENFSRSDSRGVNLCRLAVGLDLSEPTSSNWSSKTSLKFEHVCPVSDEGRSISRDLHGLPVTCSLTGGSVVGDIAPYQAFAIGGLGSVRGYGEGAVGSGRSCLVANSELTLPLFILRELHLLRSRAH